MIMIDDLWNRLVLNRKKVQYGNNLHIRGRLFVHGKKNGIVIGNNVSIYSSENVNPTGGGNHSHLRAEGDGRIIVGDGVGMSHVNITSFEMVNIGDNVLIGSGVKIWDTDFHSVNYEERRNDRNVNSAPIIIRNGAFIGACSIVLKGVTIGERAVIGAGSVVTKNIPADEIWAGNPAKFIRKI